MSLDGHSEIPRKHNKADTKADHGLLESTKQTSKALLDCAQTNDPVARRISTKEVVGTELQHLTSQRPEVLLAREEELRREKELLTPSQRGAFQKLENAHANIQNLANRLTVERLEVALVKGDLESINTIVMAYAEHPKRAKTVMDLFKKDLTKLCQGKDIDEIFLTVDWNPQDRTLQLRASYYPQEVHPDAYDLCVTFIASTDGSAPLSQLEYRAVDWSAIRPGGMPPQSSQPIETIGDSHKILKTLVVGLRPTRN